ncbi:ABC transporter ATP-binding protein [Demequina sp. NBRC 110057]|uniref:ABC transporter ATP-binding protein n=1 Tax=Demequina sp. NBRC 110057 TaxID=1570346 RepID=UPI001177AF07|nr:ATP-binding cassette domain-containing protein [Demequina sp. NBRC 110057]
MSLVFREADAAAGRGGDASPAAGPAPVLSVSELSVVFPPRRRGDAAVAVLDGVSLAVVEGEFVAVLGPSGCGKSTMLRVAGGLLAADAVVTGTVTVPRDAAGRRATAWMPQRDGLLPWRRALANAMVGAIAAGVPRERAEPRALELFEEFGLAGFERAWPHELSGGMRQRLALLRTCLAEKPVLLLDEPFGALDPVTRRRMNAWLAGVGLAQRAGSAVVLVTHDIDEAITLADRVVVLSERPGRVVLEARAADGYDREAILAALDAGGPPMSPAGRSLTA